MNNKAPRSGSEGAIVAWALLVIVICLVGSLSTGMGPVEFFFIGGLILLVAVLLAALILGITISIVHVMKATEKDDGRTLFQVLKDEYNWKAVQDDYKVIVEHVRIYAKEEWQAGPGPAMENRLADLTKQVREFWDSQIKPRIKKK